MHRQLYPAVVILIVLATGCGEKSPPPSNPAPGSGTTADGGRLAWTQPGAPSEIATFQYALYVDGERRVLQGATCNPTASEAADCTAPVPALGAGRHALELAAFFVTGDTVIEGPRSAALQVNIQGPATRAAAGTVQGGAFASSDGLTLHADVLLDDLVAPSDVAVAPDGRVFVAERGGIVRVVAPGSRPPASGQNVLRELRETGEGSALLSLALDPEFSDTGLLHVAYVTSEGDRSLVRIARVREVGGVLGQAAVTLSLATRSTATAALLRVGPDGMLYIAVDALGEPDSAQRLSEPAGKLLRVRRDGSTPDGNPTSSLVLSSGHREPRGLAWRSDGSLWEVERDDGADEVNRIAGGANYGWPLSGGRIPHPGAVPPSMLLPPDTEAAGLTSVTPESHPLAGALIVSAAGGEDLLVLRMGPAGRPRVTARLLEGRFGRIGQVAAATDGALYFLTANEVDRGGYEALIQLQAAHP
jgi:glucose/arabinose dehydrogenase